MQRVVISGATGLVGTHLVRMLEEHNYDVVYLTRHRRAGDMVKSYLWDPAESYADSDAFHDGDIIIHLGGANIGAQRWSRKRKEEIVSSRVDSANLLIAKTVKAGIYPSAFITASATGYYGAVTTPKIFIETDPPASDFLGETCRLWESAADSFEMYGVRVVKIRTAVVLAVGKSALTKMTWPVSAGLIIRFGPGHQYFPWIHIDDLCAVYLQAVKEESMSVPYNAAAPDQITHDMLMVEIARQRHLPVFLPRVPSWLLRTILGEMSVVITRGSRISSEHLLKSGFEFRYPDIRSALKAC